VLNAARYKAVQGGPKYLACYELESANTWYSDAWQKWLNDPTEWSKRMSPSVIGTAYIRNLYTCIYPDSLSDETARSDMAPVLLVGRMSVPSEIDQKFNKAYNEERLPEALKIPGYIRARRWAALMRSPKYYTVHEMESMDVVNGEGLKALSPMVTPVWNTEVRPHMVHEEGSPGIFRRIFPE
jgi:hypothetical protein